MTTFSPLQKPSTQPKISLFNPLNRDRNHLPLLIYLPGMDGTGNLFTNQIPGMTSQFNLRCLKIPSTDLSDWKRLTQSTIDCLQQELNTIPQRQIYLCGESFGGCLAMSVAANAPELIKGMIVINPASSFNQQPILGWGINLIRVIPEWVHRNSAVGLLPFLADLNRLSADNRRALLEAMKSLPQEVVSWRLALLRDFSLNWERCQKFQKPTLILASKRDRLLPSVTEAARLADLFPQAITKVLPYSGHACLLESEINLVDILKQQSLFKITNY